MRSEHLAVTEMLEKVLYLRVEYSLPIIAQYDFLGTRSCVFWLSQRAFCFG